MKTLLILVLLVVLAGGSWLSKPSQDNFTAYINAQTQPGQSVNMQTLGKSILGAIVNSATTPALQYHDHLFWATEDVNGKSQYFGAFGHWWKMSAPTTNATPTS
jgi:hypothetical protein